VEREDAVRAHCRLPPPSPPSALAFASTSSTSSTTSTTSTTSTSSTSSTSHVQGLGAGLALPVRSDQGAAHSSQTNTGEAAHLRL